MEIQRYQIIKKIGIVAANNHYGGFGLGTVNMFREIVNQLEVKKTSRLRCHIFYDVF